MNNQVVDQKIFSALLTAVSVKSEKSSGKASVPVREFLYHRLASWCSMMARKKRFKGELFRRLKF